MPRSNFKKVRHDKAFRLAHEGQVWTVDLAEWRDAETGKGELRCYRVEGNVTTPLLAEALRLEAQARGLDWHLAKNKPAEPKRLVVLEQMLGKLFLP
jgi:hypothetical protein